ncbi:MAG: signal recognition particle protein [Anaerolineales bacterium]|nr:signal recognition particle protein [Anaerolineales bacterium]
MFSSLTEKLQAVFNNLARRGKLSEADVDAGLREVRLALLEADVHFSVVKSFLDRVRARAVGAEVSRALNPTQQVIKIVHEELIATLGEPGRLNLRGPQPRVILMVGLQGSGKTTTAAKLARRLRAQGERVLLVAGDPYRPAAVTQLETLGRQIDVEVYTGLARPAELCAEAVRAAERQGKSVVIIDTAGRTQIDSMMMSEVLAIKQRVNPVEVLLVADAMTGQESVRIAEAFHKQLTLTGLILTKMDGDARGGAAISMRAVTGVPIKFLGVGEKVDALEPFDPARVAGRILGMGDVLGLIERAEAMDKQKVQEAAERLISGEFTLEDFVIQLREMRKMGPLGQLLGMIPGLSTGKLLVEEQALERQLKRTEAIINSMTIQERRHPEILNGSRKRRIAAGSGTQVYEVNQLLKQFKDMQKLMKQMGGKKRFGGLSLPKLGR